MRLFAVTSCEDLHLAHKNICANVRATEGKQIVRYEVLVHEDENEGESSLGTAVSSFRRRR